MADDVTGASKNRAGRRAADEERAADQERAADDGGARLSDERCERPAEREPEEAARVLAEDGHEAEEADPHPEPERPDVEQVAPREHEAAQGEQRQRKHVRGVPEERVERVGQPGAHGAAVEADVEDRGEDEPERAEREPEELVLVL